MSDSFWRRAVKSVVDPLPHVRAGLGEPRCARILILRDDIEAWLRRRASEANPASIVEEIVEKALRP
jgi:hypothetical protein